MLLQEEQFKTYIKVTRGISDKTVQHYITGLQSINTILQKNHFKISNVFAVKSFEELDEIKTFLDSNDEYLIKDTIGHRMYSVSFKHFYRFAYKQIASEK